MVAVCVVVEPWVALVGVPISIITVSSDSSRESSVTVKSFVPVNWPAVTIILPSARSWSVVPPVAVPLTVNGTVTSKVLVTSSSAVTVTVPTSSATDREAVEKSTTGGASSSVMVTVWVVGATGVALVGLSISTITVSSPSMSLSSAIVTMISAVVVPA